MTQIDITIRGVHADKIAAIVAVIAADLTVNPSFISANALALKDEKEPRSVGLSPEHAAPYEFPNPAGAFAGSAAIGGYTTPQFTPNTVAAIDAATAGGLVEGGTYQPYDPNVAAGVFGAKVGQQVASLQEVYAPAASVVTGLQSTPNQPAHSVAGGTPAPAGNYPATVNIALGLDSKGRPWDKRIHSSGNDKKLAKTQEWKLARGIDKNLVTQVLAELDALGGGAPAIHAPPPANLGVQRFNDQVVQPAHHGAHSVPLAHQAPAAYTPPVATGLQFADVVPVITAAIASKRVPAATISGLFGHFQILDIADLERHPDKWPTIISEVNRLSGAQ